ncbi:hypothetical protein Tco_1314953 [Tanacetum coccineum]
MSSLKALDEGYSSKNYVRKFLRALHPKWRAKVTAIEESKDLTSLSLDELIGNLKIHKMIIKKDSEIVKAKVERKSLALKAKKESSDKECSTYGSEDEYGDEDDEKVKDETCLVAHASSEGIFSNHLTFSDEKIISIDDISLDNEYDKLSCSATLQMTLKTVILISNPNDVALVLELLWVLIPEMTFVGVESRNSLVLFEVSVFSAEHDEGKHYNIKAYTNKDDPPEEVWGEEWHQCYGERYKNDKKEGPFDGISVEVLFLVICACELPYKGIYI